MRRPPSFGLDGFNWFLLGLATAILIFLIAVPPIVGIGDNGDWWRIMHPVGFRHLTDLPQDAGFFVSKVAFSPISVYPLTHGPVSSGLLLAGLARAVGPLISRDGLFYIPVLGLLHAIVLLIGLGLILRGTQDLPKVPRRVFAVLLVVFFTDLGYAAFLNTFYSQVASLLFLLTTAGSFLLLLGGQRATFWYAVFVTSALLFVTSKPQEAPESLLLAVVIALSARLTRLRRPLLAGLSLAVLVVGLAFVSATRSNGQLHDHALFNQVFHDLLQYSLDPVSDLRALNLDPGLVRYKSHHAFEADSPVENPEFREEFFAKLDFHNVWAFYLTRPGRFWNLLSRRAQLAFTLVTSYGNYDRSEGRAHGATSSSFRFWSNFKTGVFPGSIWTLIVLFTVHFVGIYVFWRRGSRSHRFRLGIAGFAVLNLMAIGAFLICALCDGRLDIIRQLFAFNAMTDLMLVTDVAAMTHIATLFWQRRNRVA